MPTSADKPPPNPYARFAGSELILRDQLAIDRTVLANERTLLAYARTSLALVISGAGAIKFLEHPVFSVSGWLVIALGIVVAWVGLSRYRRVARNVASAGAAAAGAEP